MLLLTLLRRVGRMYKAETFRERNSEPPKPAICLPPVLFPGVVQHSDAFLILYTAGEAMGCDP